MQDFRNEGKAVGLVLDLSLRHEAGGRRLLDVVKEQLVELVRLHFEDGLDAFYLYHPELVDSVYKCGEQTAAVSNYETDGWQFNVGQALQQALYVVACEDYTLRKYLLYVTDRVRGSAALEQLLSLNRKDGIDAHLVLVGVGDKYDREGLDCAALLGRSDGSVTVLHLPEPSQLLASLTEETHGQEDSRGAATQRPERLPPSGGHRDPVPRPVRAGDAAAGEHLPADAE